MRYLVATAIKRGKGHVREYGEKEGELLIVPGYEEFKFYYTADSFCNDIEVTEIKTGMLIATGHKTLKSAIKFIKGKIELHGIEKVRQKISENLIPKSKRLPEEIDETN